MLIKNITIKVTYLYKVSPKNLEIATVFGINATVNIRIGNINVRGFWYFKFVIFLNIIDENCDAIVK